MKDLKLATVQSIQKKIHKIFKKDKYRAVRIAKRFKMSRFVRYLQQKL
jgi:hypothetical protein